MIKLQFLGTCAGIPSKERNVSSLVVQMLQYKDECWMFDCGEATQHQMLYSTMTLSKINKIFITHLHGDHIFGLPGLLGSRSFQGATTKLTIYGPKGINKFIETSLEISNTYLRYPIEVKEIEEGVIEKTEFFTFEAFLLEHGLASYGFRITEMDTSGTLDVEKLKKLGITPGPIYKELKAKKTVTLENGFILDGNDFVGATKKGKTIAIAGDTRKCESLKGLSRDADILIHESTYLHKDKDLAFEHFHSTAYEAAQLADEMGVKVLFLNHISSRYTHDVSLLLGEARSVFPQSFIANDLQTYIITANGSVQLQGEQSPRII